MWGVILDPVNQKHAPTRIILGKFLKARDYNFNKTEEMLRESLIWRSRQNPRALMQAAHDIKFQGLGFVTTHVLMDGKTQQVVTWNLWTNKSDFRSQKDITGDVCA